MNKADIKIGKLYRTVEYDVPQMTTFKPGSVVVILGYYRNQAMLSQLVFGELAHPELVQSMYRVDTKHGTCYTVLCAELEEIITEE